MLEVPSSANDGDGLVDGGDTGRRLRAFDWGGHPLGPPRTWPSALRIAVNQILSSPESMYLCWGPALHFFSNDTYAPLLGPRLGRSVGTTLPALWPDAFEAVRPSIEKAMAGDAVRFVDMPIDMARQGVPEQTWWTFSFSPLFDENGRVAGAVCITNEQTERILSMQAQRASDERNRQILDSAIDYAIISTDLDGRITSWNAGARNIMGWTEEEMRGDIADRIFTPEDVASGVPAREMLAALQTGHGNDERWHLRKNGERFWASGEMMALRDGAGEVAGFLKILRDRTEQRRAAQTLRASQKRLEIAHETGLLSFFEWDVRGGMARGDANFAKVYGFTADEAASGIPLEKILGRADPEHRDQYADSVAGTAASASDYTREVKLRHPDGTVHWLLVRASCTSHDDAGPLGFTGIALDITATKTAEELLRRANVSLERRVDERTRERDRTWTLSRDLIGVADNDGAWLSINPAWTRTLGWTDDQIVGRTSEWMEHPDDRRKTRGEIRDLASGEITGEFVNRFRCADGSYRWLAWTAVMDDGRLYCSARDVTEATERQAQLEQAEDALRQAQKMEAIGQLTGGVAHDFNNLLTIIRSSVDLMRHPKANEERRGRYLNAISDTVDRASRLTGQLLAFARRQALQPEVFEVNHRLLTVAEMIRTMVGSLVPVEVRCTLDSQFTHADTSQFDTALVNLAVNARDAMEGHGRIRIGVREVASIPAHRLQPAIAGRFVAVSVADEGHGIPPELIDKVFEPFFTTKAVGKGTGLGLSQVFGFVRQSGGETRVESEPGNGTTFTMYLPAADAPPVAENAGGSAGADGDDGPSQGDGCCVLLVEDNREVGTFSNQILQDLGYRTQWATSGEQARELLAEADNRFDVVLSDVMMPGISGVELALGLRESHPDLPVILTSGYSNVLAQDGGHGFALVQKPYSVEALARALSNAVRRQQAKSGRQA